MDNAVTHCSTTKRVFHLKENTFEPYHKKPKIIVFQYAIKSILKQKDLSKIEYRGILWMMSIALDKTPFWTGWNLLVNEDPLLRQ